MSASRLELRRCAHHADREAVARCPRCGRYFCRECITEHAGCVLCARCLGSVRRQDDVRSGFLRRLAPLVQFVFGLLLIWGCFFYLGQTLIALPDDFHEGTVWQTGWWESS
ncbi:MAG: hypothetical protein JJV98_14080 [Desulfosarcina sp.]|nr:hypothetical protein [Desulfobacterales bacterium]